VGSGLEPSVFLGRPEFVGVDHIQGAFIFACGLMISPGEFIFFVAGEPVFFDVFVRQFGFGVSFGVFAGNIGRPKDLPNRVSAVRVGFEGLICHPLDVFENLAFGAVGQNFLINVGGHA